MIITFICRSVNLTEKGIFFCHFTPTLWDFFNVKIKNYLNVCNSPSHEYYFRNVLLLFQTYASLSLNFDKNLMVS